MFHYSYFMLVPFVQECQDHHPAKDGDGWVEQTGQAFFFGIFQKVRIILKTKTSIQVTRFRVGILFMHQFELLMLYIWCCLQIDIPHAYACADGMVYEVTEWVLCQVCFSFSNSYWEQMKVLCFQICESSLCLAK